MPTVVGRVKARGFEFRRLGLGHADANHCGVDRQLHLHREADQCRKLARQQDARFGEILWWFQANASGIAFYDADTRAVAQSALGRPLATFLTPNDDPSINSYADANFLEPARYLSVYPYRLRHPRRPHHRLRGPSASYKDQK